MLKTVFTYHCRSTTGSFHFLPCTGSVLPRINLKNCQVRLIVQPTSKYSLKVTENSDTLQIYDGPLSRKMRMLKIVTLSSSILGLAIQPSVFRMLMETNGTSGGINATIVVALCSFLGIITFVTPLVIHFITKKYIIKMYYNPSTDNYTAVFWTLFTTKKYVTFKVEDVTVPDITGLFTTAYVKKNIPVFFDIAAFNDLSHYKRLLGYDKPISLHLDTDAKNEKEQK